MSDPVWRSFLYIPGHVEKFVAKAAASGTDVVLLDLEDAVPADNKQTARDMLQSSAAQIRDAGTEVAVRINQNPVIAAMDIKAAVCEPISILILPKVEQPQEVRAIAEQLDALEVAAGLEIGHTSLIALIETPEGLLNAPQVAKAHPRLKALSLGTEDFAFEMGMVSEWTSLLYPSQQLIVACRAAGIIPLGYAGSIAQFRDIDAFSDIAVKSVRLGFEGGFAIHPAQVGALNDAFSPSAEEVEQSKRIVEALRVAEEKGVGAAAVDGKMVDLPVALRAEKIIQRAALIADRKS